MWSWFGRKREVQGREDCERILRGLRQVQSGNLETEIRVDSDPNLAEIADACNEMIESLRRERESARQMAELVAAAQNKQLESQFNPHFLYNTLENIRYMCRLDPSSAEQMVRDLSGLMRYSLENSGGEVILSEDLDHLSRYLAILKCRFGERFQFTTEISEQALSCWIPKLVLQPMIENAVKYGFGGKKKEIHVNLKAYCHEGTLFLLCRDDGMGMSQSALKNLADLLEQRENTSRHSGLYNIHRRIGLLYGRPYGVKIRSLEGEGTALVVTIPVHEGEEKDATDSDRRG